MSVPLFPFPFALISLTFYFIELKQKEQEQSERNGMMCGFICNEMNKAKPHNHERAAAIHDTRTPIQSRPSFVSFSLIE